MDPEQLQGDENEDEAREKETDDEKIERLGKEIHDLKEEVERMLSSSPPITRPPVPEPLLKLRHAIKEKDTERELLLEDQRVSKVIEEYLQENPSILKEVNECPICLEPIFDVGKASFFICCGNKVCGSCSDPLYASASGDTCLLCREELNTDGEALSILRTKAAEGKAWAQCLLGTKYFGGTLGLTVDRQRAESLYRKAADQGHPEAQYYLGKIEDARSNYAEACRLFEAAASQGHMIALCHLGIQYCQGHGVEQDLIKAVRLITIAAKLQTTVDFADRLLANSFASGTGGLQESMVRATHYLKRAIENHELPAQFTVQYASFLRYISASYYPDYIIAPAGHNLMPEALFWYRRAHAIPMSSTAPTIPSLETYDSSIKELCSFCYKRISTDKPKCCVECRAVYYCSRECQVADWKAGHKKDCVKALKKRLSAAGNSFYV
eukprot:CAMPEP_0178724432 /NCGR_PEP_ID=MMETSP0699-20121125/26106_1 /TAXON_ID=265572 /ORGANISM="Extubocellulus spinifer, Strain CCMP396" /LENGTH=439 /DNA_ID=CAMNT_0020375637 /DNA_START=935 /DNA_END=2254 /DNA_ORIENTATION=+